MWGAISIWEHSGEGDYTRAPKVGLRGHCCQGVNLTAGLSDPRRWPWPSPDSCAYEAQAWPPSLPIRAWATSPSYVPGTSWGPGTLSLSTKTGARPWEAGASKEAHRAAPGGQSSTLALSHPAWRGHFSSKKERSPAPWIEFQGPRIQGPRLRGGPQRHPIQSQPLSQGSGGDVSLTATPPGQKQTGKQESGVLPRRGAASLLLPRALHGGNRCCPAAQGSWGPSLTLP